MKSIIFIPEVETPDNTQSTNTMMAALSRDESYILTPSKSSGDSFKSLLGEPNWDTVYSLLSKETASQAQLSSKEEIG